MSSTRSSSPRIPASAMRWYSPTVKLRLTSGMPILSVLLGGLGKWPAWHTMQPGPSGAVIERLRVGALSPHGTPPFQHLDVARVSPQVRLPTARPWGNAGLMTLFAPRSPCGAPSRTVPFSLLPLLFLGGLLGVAEPGAAQVPTAAQAQQMLQQNPGLGDVLRQRIQQSGLTAEQVRARLQASGYPANLLDAYLGGGAAAAGAQPGTLELAAIQALGLQPVGGAEALPVDTGFIRVRGGTVPRSRVFGVDAFRRTTAQFLPLLSGPVPPASQLGAGDALALILTGDVELAYTLQVTREGFILIPQVGQVFVSNLTLDQLRDVLYARLGRVYSGVKRSPGATTRFDISVANVRANQAYVVGEVAQPGAYQISSLGTVLTALYAAGGVTERANLRTVEVRRLGKSIATLDLYDYLLRGDTRNDIRLETGDVVFVGVHGTRVKVTGAVRRPATYELKPGETLANLLVAAGGFKPDGSLRRVVIERILPGAGRGAEATARARVEVPLGPLPHHAGGSRERGAVPSDPSV